MYDYRLSEIEAYRDQLIKNGFNPKVQYKKSPFYRPLSEADLNATAAIMAAEERFISVSQELAYQSEPLTISGLIKRREGKKELRTDRFHTAILSVFCDDKSHSYYGVIMDRMELSEAGQCTLKAIGEVGENPFNFNVDARDSNDPTLAELDGWGLCVAIT